MKCFLNIAFLFILSLHCQANKNNTIYFIDSTGCLLDSALIEQAQLSKLNYSEARPNPILQLLKRKQLKNKKIVAAALAFPFPFGIVGLHRIYLGTAPHVPVVYIGSLGGIFGILPFIDFCVILLDKDFERYNNNSKIFMWVN